MSSLLTDSKDVNFYPRSPCGERPCNGNGPFAGLIISIHALLAESDALKPQEAFTARISIHALLAESDGDQLKRAAHPRQISIHALLAESDRSKKFKSCCNLEFLSTLSLRRATRKHTHQAAPPRHFYPRSPCGERRHEVLYGQNRTNFYPRSPCGERRSLSRPRNK